MVGEVAQWDPFDSDTEPTDGDLEVIARQCALGRAISNVLSYAERITEITQPSPGGKHPARIVMDDIMFALWVKYTYVEDWRRVEELASMPYQDYLQTPEWQEKRRVIRAICGGRCQMCGRSESDGAKMHVHHNTYESRGREPLEDLTLVCDRCHGRHHGIRR